MIHRDFCNSDATLMTLIAASRRSSSSCTTKRFPTERAEEIISGDCTFEPHARTLASASNEDI